MSSPRASFVPFSVPLLLFLDRSARGDDPWLNFKVGAFTAGAGAALAGIYFNARWLIWVAIGILLLGFAARFLGSRGEGSGPEETEGEDDLRGEAPRENGRAERSGTSR